MALDCRTVLRQAWKRCSKHCLRSPSSLLLRAHGCAGDHLHDHIPQIYIGCEAFERQGHIGRVRVESLSLEQYRFQRHVYTTNHTRCGRWKPFQEKTCNPMRKSSSSPDVALSIMRDTSRRTSNVPRLARQATNATQTYRYVSIRKSPDGMYNRALLLSIDNGKEVVGKNHNPNSGYACFTTAREVATTKPGSILLESLAPNSHVSQAREVLRTPLPQVHARCSRAREPPNRVRGTRPDTES